MPSSYVALPRSVSRPFGAWGVGTYRQHDSIDVRYRRDGRPMLAEGLDIVLTED